MSLVIRFASRKVRNIAQLLSLMFSGNSGRQTFQQVHICSWQPWWLMSAGMFSKTSVLHSNCVPRPALKWRQKDSLHLRRLWPLPTAGETGSIHYLLHALSELYPVLWYLSYYRMGLYKTIKWCFFSNSNKLALIKPWRTNICLLAPQKCPICYRP